MPAAPPTPAGPATVSPNAPGRPPGPAGPTIDPPSRRGGPAGPRSPARAGRSGTPGVPPVACPWARIARTSSASVATAPARRLLSAAIRSTRPALANTRIHTTSTAPVRVSRTAASGVHHLHWRARTRCVHVPGHRPAPAAANAVGCTRPPARPSPPAPPQAHSASVAMGVGTGGVALCGEGGCRGGGLGRVPIRAGQAVLGRDGPATRRVGRRLRRDGAGEFCGGGARVAVTLWWAADRARGCGNGGAGSTSCRAKRPLRAVSTRINRTATVAARAADRGGSVEAVDGAGELGPEQGLGHYRDAPWPVVAVAKTAAAPGVHSRVR